MLTSCITYSKNIQCFYPTDYSTLLHSQITVQYSFGECVGTDIILFIDLHDPKGFHFLSLCCCYSCFSHLWDNIGWFHSIQTCNTVFREENKTTANVNHNLLQWNNLFVQFIEKKKTEHLCSTKKAFLRSFVCTKNEHWSYQPLKQLPI